jgi:hypothetical protein
MLELRVPKGATLAAQLDELVLLNGEDELRALSQGVVCRDRPGSIKRVAAAVGEGAQVVATLHATLASMESNIPGEPGAQRD